MCCNISLLFNLHSPDGMVWIIFSYAYLPSMYLLWWGVNKDQWPIFFFFFLVRGCLFSYCWVLKSSLYMLDNSPLSNMSFANIFSCSVAFLLILLAVILKAKVFNFYEMQLIDSFLYESCFLSFLLYLKAPFHWRFFSNVIF